MCMLTYYPPGTQPIREHLDFGANANPHGHGYALITADNRLLVGKSMFATSLIDEFIDLRGENPEGPALFHSRISTSGGINLANCHPFPVGGDPDTVIAHNGVLFTPKREERRSDTRIFAEDIFPIVYRKLDQVKVRKQLREYLFGKNSLWPNKMVVLTVNPRYRWGAYLFGAHKGYWVDAGDNVVGSQVPGAVWHSNYGFRAAPKVITYSGNKKGSYWWDDASEPKSEAHWEDCPSCLTPQGVDPVTRICGWCNMCADCEEDMLTCDCYVSPSAITRLYATKGER